MKIRILHCLATLHSGGVEKRRLLLISRLDPAKYEHKIICTVAKEPIKSAFIKQGIEIREIGRFSSFFDFKKFRLARKIIREWKPHIVHGAVFEGVTTATFGSLFNHVPVLITEETSDPQNRSKKATLLLRLLFKASDFTVGISPSVCNYLKNEAGVPAHKLRLINNGVEKPVMPDEHEILQVKKQSGIQNGDFVIGSVGRFFDDHKKFSDLIKAVSLLKDHIPHVKLMIVGDGPDKEKFVNLSKELNVEERIIYPGFHLNINPYYACMDVFALVSSREGFGLVVVEAMLFKLPVVASRVGGIRDILQDNIYGIPVTPGNVEEIANAIKLLYEDKQYRQALGIKGYQHATENYTSDIYIKKVEALYEEACKKAGLCMQAN